MQTRPIDRFKLLAVVAAVLAFQLLFYTQTLYESGADDETRLTRLQVLELTIGHPEPSIPNLLLDALDRLSNVRNLSQRVPLFLAALTIVLTALAIGDLLARTTIRPEPFSNGLERLLFAFGLGMGVVSLLTQLLGLAGWLNRPVAAVLATIAIITWLATRSRTSSLRPQPSASNPSPAAIPSTKEKIVRERAPRPCTQGRGEGVRGSSSLASLKWIVLLAVTPFVLLATLAAALPTPDYDAVAYHLLGPKEYFLAGRIEFLPHNVYTTFPFFAEMFHLLSMVTLNDCFLGGLAGAVTLSLFGPATGAAVGLLADRLFGRTAGWLAAMVYLTTPWTYRLSVIPYVEGPMLFYATLAIYAAFRLEKESTIEQSVRWSLLAGCFSGIAIACKYPGLVMVALPVGFLVIVRSRGKRLPVATAFIIGCAIFIGPWFLRNALWTGNPVYPLAYGIFDGADWSAEQAARFSVHHHSSVFTVDSFFSYLWDVLLRSDRQSALLFCFAPLALLGAWPKRALGLWGLIAYLYLAFWLLTHRLDRFWLPIEPIAAVLAGAGLVWSTRFGWRVLVVGVCSLGILYNLGYSTSALSGLANYTADLNGQREQNIRSLWPALQIANDPKLVPPESTVLFVGFAAVYDSIPPALYNTTWNDNVLESIVRQPGEADALKPTPEILAEFARRGVDFVLVDWNWIERYRSPGNYGFTDFVQPQVFEELMERGILTKVPLYAFAAHPPDPGAAPPEPIQLFRVTRKAPAP